jgi:hypothetical protein
MDAVAREFAAKLADFVDNATTRPAPQQGALRGEVADPGLHWLVAAPDRGIKHAGRSDVAPILPS